MVRWDLQCIVHGSNHLLDSVPGTVWIPSCLTVECCVHLFNKAPLTPYLILWCCWNGSQVTKNTIHIINANPMIPFPFIAFLFLFSFLSIYYLQQFWNRRSILLIESLIQQSPCQDPWFVIVLSLNKFKPKICWFMAQCYVTIPHTDYFILHGTVLILSYTVLYNTVQYFTVHYSTVLYYKILYCIVLNSTLQHYVSLQSLYKV